MKKILIVFLSAATLFLAAVPLFAQEATTITVFPTVQEISVKPGMRAQAAVSYQNSTDRVIQGNVRVADFIIVDKEGTPVFLNDQELKPKYSASSWISLSNNFIAIAPHNLVTISLFIDPPLNLTSCGYYAAIYFEPQNAAPIKTGGRTETASGVTSRIGALLNFTVDKGTPCNENVSVSAFNLPFFLENGPIPVKFDLLNTGDIHLVPKGNLTLTNIFGGYVDAQAIREQRIFPETAKTYSNSFGPTWMLGRYKVSLAASYGNQGKTLAYAAYVWIFPWKLALVIILALLILYLLLRTYSRGLLKKEGVLEQQIEKEKEEIDKLKDQLKRRE